MDGRVDGGGRPNVASRGMPPGRLAGRLGTSDGAVPAARFGRPARTEGAGRSGPESPGLGAQGPVRRDGRWGPKRFCRIPRARCEEYLNDGLTYREIAAREGWDEKTIAVHCRGLGLTSQPRQPVVTLLDVESAREGRETVREVADRLGVTIQAVHLCAYRHGTRIARRPSRLDYETMRRIVLAHAPLSQAALELGVTPETLYRRAGQLGLPGDRRGRTLLRRREGVV